MSQGQACQWIHILSEVLQCALAELEQVPERDPQKDVFRNTKVNSPDFEEIDL